MADIELVIKIPKEFEEHFNTDRFEDSIQRVRVDIHKSIIGNKFVLSGNREIETLDMLTEAFLNSTPLPEYYKEKNIVGIEEWLSTFNADSATECYTAVQNLKRECENG